MTQPRGGSKRRYSLESQRSVDPVPGHEMEPATAWERKLEREIEVGAVRRDARHIHQLIGAHHQATVLGGAQWWSSANFDMRIVGCTCVSPPAYPQTVPTHPPRHGAARVQNVSNHLDYDGP